MIISKEEEHEILSSVHPKFTIVIFNQTKSIDILCEMLRIKCISSHVYIANFISYIFDVFNNLETG